MTDAFYAIVIIAFASMAVLTLFNHLVRGNEIRDEIHGLNGAIDGLDERLASIRQELESIKFDSGLLNDERVALEAQRKCLLDLEEAFLRQQKKVQGQR